MSFLIEYRYKTGNSFGSSNEAEKLPLTWEDYKAAKDALRRIKEHYEYYQEVHSYSYGKQADAKKSKEDAKLKDWFVEESELCLKIKADNGADYQFYAPWCGYFERLHVASIISDDRITF